MEELMKVRNVSLLTVAFYAAWFIIGFGKGLEEDVCDRLITEGCTSLTIRARSHYRAAVVEYKPIPIGNQAPKDAVLTNARKYIELMENARAQNADIIVFPECGITTLDLPSQRVQGREYFVQIPPIGENPCDNFENLSIVSTTEHQILQELSCGAKNNRIYTVVNLGEYELCDKNVDSQCPDDGAYQYNTNIVFDRNGTIVARYRKYHLYFEPLFDYPSLEYVTFVTDFGIEFGIFTCFDILFAHPAVELVASKGIRNFVFPTAWVDELPFLTAIQAQSLWAQSNGANLLASGYHQPDRGKMGSGIFSGRKSANYVFDVSSGTKLIVSDVPLMPEYDPMESREDPIEVIEDSKTSENSMDAKSETANHFWLREDLSNCSYKSINPHLKKDSLCHEQFCCEIEYDLLSSTYAGDVKLLVFDGRRTVAAKQDWFDWQVCGIIHCLNDTIESCTEIIPQSDAIDPTSSSSFTHPKFRMVKMRARPLNIEYGQNEASKPALSLLDTHLKLIPSFCFHLEQWKDEQENHEHVVNALSKENCGLEKVNVKTIAIIQRVYNGRI